MTLIAAFRFIIFYNQISSRLVFKKYLIFSALFQLCEYVFIIIIFLKIILLKKFSILFHSNFAIQSPFWRLA